MNNLIGLLVVGSMLATAHAGTSPAALARWQDPARPQAQEPAAKPQFDEAAWRTKLTQTDLVARERALEEVAELARRDVRARAALEQWSKDKKDAELAWTSRLALRLAGGARLRHRDEAAQRAGLRDEFELLFAHVEDLQAQMDELLEGEAAQPPAPGARVQSQKLELQFDDKGVTCKVVDEVDGVRQEHEYRAATLGELLATHPELRQHIRSRVAEPFGIERFWRPFFRAPRTDLLGIEATPPTAEHTRALSLEQGQGLLVARTLPGTIAEAMGLRPGDVVITLNGAAIRTAEDVAKVLRERSRESDVVAVVGDKSGKRRTLTWKPAHATAAVGLREGKA
jgi:hypothetical protein